MWIYIYLCLFLYNFSYHIYHFSMTFPSLFEISVKLLLKICTCTYVKKLTSTIGLVSRCKMNSVPEYRISHGKMSH